MKKKPSLKLNRKLMPVLVITFVVVIIISAVIIWYILSNNYITVENIDKSADTVSDATVKDAASVIVNGVVLGGYSENSWVSSMKIYDKNKSTSNLDIEMYSSTGLLGSFKTASFKKYENEVAYTTTTKVPTPENYIAIEKTEDIRTFSKISETAATKQDEKYVKQALGKYKLLNNTVKITEVYEARVKNNEDRIICAVSKKSGIFGAYSAVIYVSNSEAKVVKYSYVKDEKNSTTWPVYSLKFVIDINCDGMSELVIQETTENTVSYSVMELKTDKFYQVLKATLIM